LLTSIVAAVAVLALLIVVHEAGHFAVAKWVGVRVVRFSVGYPPKVWGFRRGETEYAIGATPFGGYVRMLGEELSEQPRPDETEYYVRELALDVLDAARRHGWKPATRDHEAALVALARQVAGDGGEGAAAEILGRELKPDEAPVIEEIARCGSLSQAQAIMAENPPESVMGSFRRRSFPTQKLWKRVLIVLAGPFSNILFAPVVMTLVFMYGVPSLLPIVGKVSKDLPAAAAGLVPGDRVLAVNGAHVETWEGFARAVRATEGKPVTLKLQRAGASATVVIQPKLVQEPSVYGTDLPVWVIGVRPRGDETTERFGPIGAVEHGVVWTVNLAGSLVAGVAQVVKGTTPVREAIGGPIIIAEIAGHEARQGLADLLMFAVMLSLELGVINLLPVPLLDGGHLAFFLFEGIRGEPLQLRYREIALEVGLVLLVALMAFVIFNDISRIAQG
jgi:regulator of sigma E protease